MREVLFVGVLMLALGTGVVVAKREGVEGGFVSGWIQSQQPSPAAATQTALPKPPPEAIQEPASPELEPEPTRPEVALAAAPSVLTAGEISVLEPDAAQPMVRYVDAQGSIQMVRGLARVPTQYRGDAVVLGRGNVNRMDVPAPNAVAFQDWQPEPNPNRMQVVLFSAPWCGACKRAKRYLDRQGVPYLERDISADHSAKQEVRSIVGQVAVPLLEVNGRYISGFRRDVYDRALGGS